MGCKSSCFATAGFANTVLMYRDSVGKKNVKDRRLARMAVPCKHFLYDKRGEAEEKKNIGFLSFLQGLA